MARPNPYSCFVHAFVSLATIAAIIWPIRQGGNPGVTVEPRFSL